MAETPSDQENAGDNGRQAPTEEAAASLAPPATTMKIIRQYVKDLSFENPNAPDIFSESLETPELRVKLDLGSTLLQEDTHEVVVALQIEAAKKERTIFIVELQYAAMVTLAKNLGEDETNRNLLIETPRHLFPFIRAAIANLTREGSFPPLLLNPIDFSQVFLERLRQATEKTADAQA